MDTLFQFPATVRDVSLKPNRSAMVKLETQEEMTDEMIAKIATYVGKTGWAMVAVERIDPYNVSSLPALPKDGKGRTASQRLRQVLWRVAEQNGIPEEKRDEFYLKEMEAIIQMIMGRLEDDGLEYAANISKV